MNVLDLARPEVVALKPYSSARMEARNAQVMLNANESPWLPVGDAGQGLNRYPEPQPAVLCSRLAEVYGVRDEQILVSRGSDEAMDLLVRVFCRPGQDAIAICPPTFGMYAVCAGVQGAGVVSVPLDADFGVDVEALLAAVTPAVKLVFLCSPNNPTGGVVPLEDIEAVAAALAERALVIVDEAYVEFADGDSAAALLDDYPNVLVLRTLSKAWALAGARIGALLAAPGIIALVRRIMPPYPLPTPSVDAALATLSDEAMQTVRERIASIRYQRDCLRKRLRALPQVRAVLPSQANFLTVRFDDAAAVYGALLAQGIVVRDVTRYPGLADCLRISVGSAQDNAQLLQVLESLAEGTAMDDPASKRERA
ncbi:MAG TPA: histidinol-phosphate transaminase [Rhodanobacteraceae bacterium]